MTAVLSRSPLTAAILTQLRTTDFPVGDAIIPDAGWQGPPMGVGSTFVPYGVLSEIVASHSSGPWADAQADWQLPYLIESMGLSREQCEAVAEVFRAAAVAMEHEVLTLGDAAYRIEWVRVDSLGQPGRVDAFDPPQWHSQDGITFWLMKGS